LISLPYTYRCFDSIFVYTTLTIDTCKIVLFFLSFYVYTMIITIGQIKKNGRCGKKIGHGWSPNLTGSDHGETLELTSIDEEKTSSKVRYTYTYVHVGFCASGLLFPFDKRHI